ncbi:hypothetical protein CesoFtcFv8_013126 [Champsocephalus esox]|uniref:Uncharacterized protein n=1 Tax=Champsocephalus esox TaxID=159716 RepID=A0AAN8GUL5_9TELE|nr:hypothetical protein CesoFtcFv8_013126 [Champsocephalus esox]
MEEEVSSRGLREGERVELGALIHCLLTVPSRTALITVVKKPSRCSLLSWSSQTLWSVLHNNDSNQKRTEGQPSRVYIVP